MPPIVYITNLFLKLAYIGAAILTVVVGWLADKYNKRGVFNIGVSFLGISGFLILLASRNARLSYAATFLSALIYPVVPNTICWVSNNVEGTYKRGVTLGIIIGWANLNGIVGSVHCQNDQGRDD